MVLFGWNSSINTSKKEKYEEKIKWAPPKLKLFYAYAKFALVLSY